MPEDFKRCKGVVAAWGLGGEAFSFPPEAGYPVGEDHGSATYYMFEGTTETTFLVYARNLRLTVTFSRYRN